MILFLVNVVQHVKIDQVNDGIAHRMKSQISTQQLAVAQPEGREVRTYMRAKCTRACYRMGGRPLREGSRAGGHGGDT